MWGTAALVALITAVIFGALDLASTEGKDQSQPASTIRATIATFVVSLGLTELILYRGTPVMNGITFLNIIWPNVLVVGVCFGIANAASKRLSLAPVGAVVCILAMLVYVIGNEMPLKGASDNYGKLLTVATATADKYPPTSDANIVTMSEQNAELKANGAMSQVIPGDKTGATISSRYDLNSCDLQSVKVQDNAHLYYICSLALTGSANNRTDKYTVPGYIVVDAQDPDANPMPKFGYKMIYTPGAPYSHSMQRLIYKWNNSVYIDGLTLEVDDQWNPYYTASIDTPGARMQQSVPRAFITVNPQTGEIKRYALNEIPSWVDRVYSADMAKAMLNWWGHWGHVKWSTQGSGGRLKVDGDITLVYTDNGPAWQALMTSTRKDSAVQFVALMDTRDANATLYPAPMGLTTQDTVKDAIEGAKLNGSSVQAEGLALHEIYGQLTWVTPIVQAGATTSGKSKSAFGLALVDARDARTGKVILGTNKDNALQKYSAQIAAGDSNNAPNPNSKKATITGAISKINNNVSLNGQTFVVFTLKTDSRVFEYQVTGDQSSNLEAVLATPNDSATITFVDTGSALVNVSSFTVTSAPTTASTTTQN